MKRSFPSTKTDYGIYVIGHAPRDNGNLRRDFTICHGAISWLEYTQLSNVEKT
jgi:hypothetical protein